MNQQQMQAFEDRLTERRERLERDIEGVEQGRVESVRPPGELSHDPTHPGDRTVENVGKELTLDETLRDELRSVNAALDRVREGTYGRCERCGGEISQERLDALPHTTLCIECERQAEATG